MLRAVTAAFAVFISTPVISETVDVKYRGIADLKPFACTDTPRSSFIQRVCYDKTQSYMLINLRGTYHHYCELPAATSDAFMVAPSMGQFYNQKIKGTGSDGPFDCERIGCQRTRTRLWPRTLSSSLTVLAKTEVRTPEQRISNIYKKYRSSRDHADAGIDPA